MAQSPTDPLARKEYEVFIAVSRLNCLDIFELQPAGRRDEARVMLAEIYNWFTEGFDTADLKDAKALFDELNA